MIVWLPEKMHPHVRNKLLKMIEEPRAYSFYLGYGGYRKRATDHLVALSTAVRQSP